MTIFLKISPIALNIIKNLKIYSADSFLFIIKIVISVQKLIQRLSDIRPRAQTWGPGDVRAASMCGPSSELIFPRLVG